MSVSFFSSPKNLNVNNLNINIQQRAMAVGLNMKASAIIPIIPSSKSIKPLSILNSFFTTFPLPSITILQCYLSQLGISKKQLHHLTNNK